MPNRTAGEDRVNTTSGHDQPHPASKGVAPVRHSRIDTALLAGAAPHTILMVEVCGAIEVGLHPAGHMHLGVCLISWNAKLRTEDRKTEIFAAGHEKLHLVTVDLSAEHFDRLEAQPVEQIDCELGIAKGLRATAGTAPNIVDESHASDLPSVDISNCHK